MRAMTQCGSKPPESPRLTSFSRKAVKCMQQKWSEEGSDSDQIRRNNNPGFFLYYEDRRNTIKQQRIKDR